MLVFALIGAAGLVLLLLSLVVGEILDVGDGALSGTSLGVGAVVFGAVGSVVTVNGWAPWIAYVASAVVGLLAVLVAQLLIRRLSATEDNARVDLVGVQGTATTDISQSSGEVALDAVSELERRLAWSMEPIASGTRVVVLEHQPNSVRVGPYRPED
ncbi:NfeD family protein [Isoptericola sp. AK164]|uniref:NfeD family protein n=1 Tax=Isoptericola sp. AK164 TaxID=3024246 RepID=UPI0024186051|nr:NfeD family protein [Isoptericola sp. AK164]